MPLHGLPSAASSPDDTQAKIREFQKRHAAKVKGWVRDILALEESVTVLVGERQCLEPNCPDMETLIALLLDPAGGTAHPEQHPHAVAQKHLLDLCYNDVAAVCETLRDHLSTIDSGRLNSP
jgi:hypothetical protein